MTHITQKLEDYSRTFNSFINNLGHFALNAIKYFIYGGLVTLLIIFLESFSTKFLLIFFSGIFMVYLFEREQKRLKEKALFKNSPSLSKNLFNAALSRELMSIKFKLNELLDEINPRFKKSDHRGDESSRKQFTRYWMAYSGYQDIVALQRYKTPEGMDGGLIILLQQVATNNKNNEKALYNYDPFSELESVNEETFIQLHSYGPLAYNHIDKLEIGDIIQAYVYDPEDFGFLEPHESKIKVVDINEHDGPGRNITVEILETHWDDHILNIQREPAIRTLKYIDL